METHQAKPRWAYSWATRLLSPVTSFVLTRFVGSVSFPSFLPVTHYTRPRLPSDGSLGSHFPTLIGTMLGYDYPMFFLMPYALARSSIPCLFPLFVSSLKARYHSGTLVITPGLLGLPVRLFRLFSQGNIWLSQVSRLPSWIYAPLFDPGGVLDTCLFRIPDCCLPLK